LKLREGEKEMDITPKVAAEMIQRNLVGQPGIDFNKVSATGRIASFIMKMPNGQVFRVTAEEMN
jgi:hypothetical protein